MKNDENEFEKLDNFSKLIIYSFVGVLIFLICITFALWIYIIR